MLDAEQVPTVGREPWEGPAVSGREFGEMLKRFRERAGLTQDAAAVSVGVSRPTFAQWEGGRHLPSEDRLVALDEYFKAEGQLIAAGGRARGPQRVRPDVGEIERGTHAKPLLQVFAEIRAGLMDQLCFTEDGRPAGWRHNLVPSSAPSRPLSTAYGLMTVAFLGSPDPRARALIGSLFDSAHREDGRLIGWRASGSTRPRVEATATVFEALYHAGADLEVDEVIRVLSALLDDTARRRPLVLTTILDALLPIAPDCQLATELVETLLSCRVDFDGVLLWPEKRVDRRHPLLQPSVAHTARAVNTLRSAPGSAVCDAVAAAEPWIAEVTDLNGVSESIARGSNDQERVEEVMYYHFTSAHVVRALAGVSAPSLPRIRLALDVLWGRYDDDLHLWVWGNGDVPTWMLMDAVRALRAAALALMPTPMRDEAQRPDRSSS